MSILLLAFWLGPSVPAAQTVADLQPEVGQRAALRAALEDLVVTYGREYEQGPAYLRQLDRLGQRLRQATPGEQKQIQAEFVQLQREALLAHPLLVRYPLLFVARDQYKNDHHNTATMFQAGEINMASFHGGGALKLLDLANKGKVTTLLDLSEGMLRDPEVHFDGERIVFAMRHHIKDDYHIYEMQADGTGLRQLTFAKGVADIDPLYLPDDRILFGSTREPKYCMCNRHIMCNLFCMDADGANIHQIGKNTLHEGHPVLMPDGRVLYDRWEYVDRNFGDAQGLWTVYPDGTNHAVFYGNNTWSPGGVIDARMVPLSGHALCVFGSCHDRPWGALALVDPRLGVDGRRAVLRTWPPDAIDLIQEKGPRSDAYGFDNFKRVQIKYEDPYPLSDKVFLCARMTGRGEQMGLYLIDVFGNEVLIHVEGAGCYDPMPLGPKFRPPVIPSRRNFAEDPGKFYVMDVYEGTHMAGVKRGSIKYLRVVESPEKRFWTQTQWGGQGVHCPAMNWHGFENKRILGTVPVEADGSAYFEVPAGKFIYFQLLDEKKMMVQSMRSGTTIQPGELIGCVGCHEDRHTSVPIAKARMPLAMKRPPSPLDGWEGPARMFSYMDDVQPVFDRHCVRCHDYQQEAGLALNLASDRTNTFNTSYNELWRKKVIAAIGAGPSDIQPAYAWGSHASKLMKVLLAGHEEVELPDDDFERLATWIDLNGPYYPRYDTTFPDHLSGRSPLNNAQVKRLSQITGVPLDKLAHFNSNLGPQVSFARPELSPCLEQVADANSPEYAEALAIIQSGQRTLSQQPRADMSGFQACDIDQQRQARYATREQIEARNRAAIQSGRKQFETRTP